MKRYISLILLLFLPQLLVGQGWHIDLSHDGALDRTVWRHDVDAYAIVQGWLSLSATPNRAGRKLISTNISLPECPEWRGVVQLVAPPTPRNSTYVLLACYAQDLKAHVYDYLAISVGGGRRSTVALSEVRVRLGSSTPWQIVGERELIDSYQMPEALVRDGLSYTVCYDRAEERLVLSLEEGQSQELFVGQVGWRAKLPVKNSFGVLCLYSSKRYEGVRFRDLSILPCKPSGLIEGEEDKSNGFPRPAPELSSLPLLITEVMANPLPGSPEYIELYNPSESPQSLKEYMLVLQAVGDKRYRLPNKEVAPKSFIVLTTQPEALSQIYANIPSGVVVRCALPRLVNAGFLLQLMRTGQRVDEMRYDPALFSRGLKGRRGVALERTHLERDAQWQSAKAEVGYATPGAPPLAVEREEGRDEVSEKDVLTELIERSQSDPELSLVCVAVDLSGCVLFRGEGRQLERLFARFAREGAPLPLVGVLAGKRGVLSIYIMNKKRSEIVDSWSIKFVCR